MILTEMRVYNTSKNKGGLLKSLDYDKDEAVVEVEKYNSKKGEVQKILKTFALHEMEFFPPTQYRDRNENTIHEGDRVVFLDKEGYEIFIAVCVFGYYSVCVKNSMSKKYIQCFYFLTDDEEKFAFVPGEDKEFSDFDEMLIVGRYKGKIPVVRSSSINGSIFYGTKGEENYVIK